MNILKDLIMEIKQAMAEERTLELIEFGLRGRLSSHEIDRSNVEVYIDSIDNNFYAGFTKGTPDM